jgi:hypothetical protein
MAIDMQSESVVTLKEAAKLTRGRRGKGRHVSTLYRWAGRGVRGGIRLETFMEGGDVMTSREALERFYSRLSGPQPGPMPKSRERAIDRAEAELRAMGV